MQAREVRMRCIEAISNFGVREVARIINDAKILEEWVMAAEDKEPTPPRGRTRKASSTADKD